METRLLGALVYRSIADSPPIAITVPFMVGLGVFFMGPALLAAERYFAMMSSTVGAGARAAGGVGGAGRVGVSDSCTGGTATGRSEPRWQEQHVTTDEG